MTAVKVHTKKADKEETFSFSAGAVHRSVEEQYNEYLISLSLAPGKYKLQDIVGISTGFLIMGNFAVPIYADFELPANKAVYLGRIEATNREKKNDDEAAAGSIIPLIDQGVTGYASGTFDVSIYDNYEKDIPLFKQKYKVLKEINIDKLVLPSWKQRTEQELAQLRQ